MNKLNEDILTRYVAGELSAEEQEAVRQALETDVAAREMVAELEATVQMMREALGAEAAPELIALDREQIRTAAEGPQPKYREKPERGERAYWRRLLIGTATVTVLATFVVAAYLQYTSRESELLAKNEALQNQLRQSQARIHAEENRISELVKVSAADTAGPDLASAAEAPASPRTEADVAKEKNADMPALTDAARKDERGDLPVAGSGAVGKPTPQQEVATQEPNNLPGPALMTPDLAEQPKAQVTPLPPQGRKPEPNGEETKNAKESKPTPAPISSSLQNVEVGGGIRIRANYYDMDDAASAPAAASPPPPPAEMAQLQSLGYGQKEDSWRNSPQDYPGREELRRQASGEAYNPITENPFKPVSQEPLSTFSIDVDTGSYSNVRRFLESGARPPADAVRIEELINYFDYAYAPPPVDAPDPFAAHVAVAACPWAPQHRLVRVVLKGREFPAESRENSNLVFLVDVSGSMDSPDKLPLVQQGLQMLVNQLGENDRVSIVVYAGSSGLVLPPTNGSNKAEILGGIERLRAGGSTNGGEGIQLAYRLAREAFIPGGVNRLILATDGDFNVGVTSQEELIRLIEKEAKSKVFLTVLGFGTGNLKDGMMEQLANKGNGIYAYIDSAREAKKVFVDQVQGSLVTIAKDVKIQIEFNPAKVQSYRLIGYENRALAAQDFNDDTKDAGEIGAGHAVTALYEIVPAGATLLPGVDALKYQSKPANREIGAPGEAAHSSELMTLKLRYKQPEGDVSKLMETPVPDAAVAFDQADEDFRFAASVAAFGMLLRGSAHAGTATMEQVRTWAADAMGKDTQGYRAEFLDLVRKAQATQR